MMKVWSLRCAVFALSASALGTSDAAQLWCEGRVGRVLSYGNGNLMLLSTFRNDWITICNLNGTASISAATCRSWHGSLLLALAAGKTVTVHFHNTGTASCLSMATYDSAPPVTYVSVAE